MGRVIEARDTRLHRDVAIKLLPAGLPDPLLGTRLAREAMFAARVQHRNVVGMYDAGISDEGQPYLVMELVRGITLHEVIGAKPMPVPEILNTLDGILAGLGAIHQRELLHRDIKPSNVLIDEARVVKLVDFGVAQTTGTRSRITETGAIAGTAAYLAPERSLGEEATEQSDLYSVGVVAYEMLTGRPPFDADLPAVLALKHIRDEAEPLGPQRPDAPASLIAFVERAMHKTPTERADSADEMRAELKQVADDFIADGGVDGSATAGSLDVEPTATKPLSTDSVRLATEQTKRRSFITIGAGLAVFGLLIWGIVGFMNRDGAQTFAVSAQPTATPPSLAVASGVTSDENGTDVEVDGDDEDKNAGVDNDDGNQGSNDRGESDSPGGSGGLGDPSEADDAAQAAEDPTPIVTTTPTATASPTPRPTAAATSTSTSTPDATSESTPRTRATTAVAEPSASSTPRPTAAASPTARRTPTPLPRATARPTVTPRPAATATATPRSTPTPTPRPTATSTPRPTATNTPRPTLLPTATPTPVPPTRGPVIPTVESDVDVAALNDIIVTISSDPDAVGERGENLLRRLRNVRSGDRTALAVIIEIRRWVAQERIDETVADEVIAVLSRL